MIPYTVIINLYYYKIFSKHAADKNSLTIKTYMYY